MAEIETVKGLRDLEAKLLAMGARTGVKTLRRATTKATTPVLRDMRARAPVGRQAHRTHKGRLVAPGFLKKSLTKKTRTRGGRVTVTLGARSEAWYGIQFYDQGPVRISTRRVSAGGRHRRKVNIKPYTLRRVLFFETVFLAHRQQMERDMAANLRVEIERAARGR